MPGQNSETTLIFRTEDADLRETDRLISSIYSTMAKMAGVGAAPAIAGGPAQISGIASHSQNVFDGRGVTSNPSATGGIAGPMPPIASPGTGAPVAGGGGSMNVGAVTINAQTVNLYAQNVNFGGAGGSGGGGGGGAGGGGGTQTPNPANRPMSQEEWDRGVRRFMRQGEEQQSGPTFGTTLRAALGGALPVLAASAFGTAIESSYGREMRWQEQLSRTFTQIPLLGPLMAPFFKPLDISASREAVDHIAVGMGIGRGSSNWWDMSDSARDLQMQAVMRGIRVPRQITDSLSSTETAPEARRSIGAAYMRTRTSPFGMAGLGLGGQMDAVSAIQTALFSGDMDSASTMLQFIPMNADITPVLRSAISARATNEARIQIGTGLAQGRIATGNILAGEYATRGEYFQAAGQTTKQGRQYGELLNFSAYQERQALEDYQNAKASGNLAGQFAAEQRLVQAQQQRYEASAQISTYLPLQQSEMLSRGSTVLGGAFQSRGQAALGLFESTGVADPTRIRHAFAELDYGLKTVIEGAVQRLKRDEHILGPEETFRRNTEIKALQAQRDALAVTSVFSTAQMLSAPIIQTAGTSAVTGQMAMLRGGGSAEVMPFMTERATTLQRAVPIAQNALDQLIRQGAPEGAIARARYGLAEAQMNALEAQHQIPLGTMPASFQGEMIGQTYHLQRQLTSWTEPGSVLDTRQKLMSGIDAQLRAKARDRQKLMDQGLWDDGMQLHYVQETEQLKMERFQHQQAIDVGWIDRLQAQSVSAPSGSYRFKASRAEAAGALDSMGMQHRDFGFTSNRGIRAEMERGAHTGGMNLFASFPGDLALAGVGKSMGEIRVPKKLSADGFANSRKVTSQTLEGLGIPVGGENGVSHDQGERIIELLTALVHGNGGNGFYQGGGGPGTTGDVGFRDYLSRQALGPGPSDQTKGRRP